MLHTTSSTTGVDVNDKNIAGIVKKNKKKNEIKLFYTKLATLEETVISIGLSSRTVKHSCTKCSTFAEIESGFYYYPSRNMMGTKEGVKTSKPKFCLKDIENNKHNFQVDASILENFIGHRVLNQVKLAKLAVSL